MTDQARDFLDQLTDDADSVIVLGKKLILRVPDISVLASLRSLVPKNPPEGEEIDRGQRFFDQYHFFGNVIAAVVVPNEHYRERSGDEWARVIIATADNQNSGMKDLLEKAMKLCDFPSLETIAGDPDDEDGDQEPADPEKNKVEKAAEALTDLPS